MYATQTHTRARTHAKRGLQRSYSDAGLLLIGLSAAQSRGAFAVSFSLSFNSLSHPLSLSFLLLLLLLFKYLKRRPLQLRKQPFCFVRYLQSSSSPVSSAGLTPHHWGLLVVSDTFLLLVEFTSHLYSASPTYSCSTHFILYPVRRWLE